MIKGVTFSPEEASKRQSEYCRANHLPLLAPKNGICANCIRNIYMPYSMEVPTYNLVLTSGITLERAGEAHATYCPHCNHRFGGF